MSASPQLEDGYIRIANELIEAILGFGFTHREQSVLFSIIRKTYGYGKKEDDISASQIGDMCKMARQHVTSTLNALQAKNIITKKRGAYGCVIGIQKNHSLWIGDNHPAQVVPNLDTCPELGLVHNWDTTSPELGQVDSPELGHTKDNLPKDNHQKKKSCAKLDALFEKFYAAYPRKKSKGAAVKAFSKINPDEQLVDAMIASIERAKKSGSWNDINFIPYPSSWLNQQKWLDEIQIEFSEEELEVIRAYNDALGNVTGYYPESKFTEKKASAIRAFRLFSSKAQENPLWFCDYFHWIHQKVTIPPSAGFDWMIELDSFNNIVSGQFNKREK